MSALDEFIAVAGMLDLPAAAIHDEDQSLGLLREILAHDGLSLDDPKVIRSALAVAYIGGVWADAGGDDIGLDMQALAIVLARFAKAARG